MHTKSLIILLFYLCTGVAVMAQKASIKGKVVDEEGNPLNGVKVTVGSFYTLTDKEGQYKLDINAGKRLLVYFTSFGYAPDTARFSVKEGTSKTIDMQLSLISNFLKDAEVTDRKARFDSKTDLKTKDIDAYVGPGSKVEGIIKTLPGVSSYNELSSQYSVRGGNFDENLVYVNGIQIYRPFLVNRGRQEGLSFINSKMVSDVDFSAGGFEARYGDKMSSVLDVTYRRPTDFALNAEASLLGGNIVYEDRLVQDRLSVMVGGRYRTNQLLLGTLDTEAEFKPQFSDIQAFISYPLSDEWTLDFLGNYTRNLYQVVPESRTTDFGTFQEALRLNVFFDGRESYDFTTRFGALRATYQPNDKLRLNFSTSTFQNTEQEYFDVIGAYELGEINNNLGSDQFGEISVVRGTGEFQNYARNDLDAIVSNVQHSGLYDNDDVTWRWGAKVQYEDIVDRYKEWERIDSAGFNVPNNTGYSIDSLIVTQIDSLGNPVGGEVAGSIKDEDSIRLFESFDSQVDIASVRLTAYLERSQIFESNIGDFFLNTGIRTHYWTFNNQNVLSPRASFSWKPEWENTDMVFRLASGFYYQPPFYREMRELDGGVNEDIRAQRSIHFVLGNDYQLRIWDRPFKMVTEVYYKHMNNLIPYSLDNVRIRYRAENSAKGFATGLEYRINGEFVKGVDSWASVSLMTVQEDIEDDGVGYLPRPTDQRVNFKTFFQDYLPNDPTFRVSLTLVYGTGLPFGPPQAEAKDREFRLPDYRRVDIGFSKVFKAEGKNYEWDFLNNFKSLRVGLEVFNLLDINNTISYLWVRDVSTSRQYAVPNYLTGRLLNAKVVASF